MTVLSFCRGSEVSQESGDREVYGAEGLEELPNTSGRGGTEEADGPTAPACAAGKRFSWESPTALVSQCSNQEPA